MITRKSARKFLQPFQFKNFESELKAISGLDDLLKSERQKQMQCVDAALDGDEAAQIKAWAASMEKCG